MGFMDKIKEQATQAATKGAAVAKDTAQKGQAKVDQVQAKRCGHRPGKEVVSKQEMVDRVKAAVDAGAQAIKAIKGEVVSVHVIARPHADVDAVLPKKK